MQSPFDPTAAYTFQLSDGHVRRSGGSASVILPAAVVAALCGALDQSRVRQAGDDLAAAVVEPLRARLGRLEASSLQDVVDQLGGELALLGLGSCSAERWGRALVVCVQASPLQGASRALLEGFLEGCLKGISERPVRVILISEADGDSRYVLCSEATSKRLLAWRDEGVDFGETMQRLNGQGGSHAS